MNGESNQPPAPDGGNWQFKPDAQTQEPQPQDQPSFASGFGMPAAQQDPRDIPADATWTASEFIAHEKTPLWYGALIIITVVVVGGSYLLTRDKIAAVALTMVGVLFGFLAAHKPRVLNYAVNARGLLIDNKFYPYSDFKSFGIVQEGAFSSIVFAPMRRFMPTLTIYYPPESEQQVVNALSQYMPFAPASHDLIDQLMRRIRL
jgi:hypothetical protein